MTRGNLLILTGGRGAGKTTLCQFLANRARAAGWDVAGVLSPAQVEEGSKTGILLKDPRRGEIQPLARLALPGEVSPTGLRWIFDPAALAWGNELLAAATPCDLLVVDELGPLELVRGEGWQAGIAALDSGAFRLALAVIRPELLDAARARWMDAEVIDVPAAGEVRTLGRQLAARFLPDRLAGRQPAEAVRFLGGEVRVVVDRPAGSIHPQQGFLYPVNYGHVPGAYSPDGDELDAYVLGAAGALTEFTGRCIAVIQRLDDDDDKLVVVPAGVVLSDDHIRRMTYFQEQWFRSVIVRE